MALLLLEGFDHYNAVSELYEKPHIGGFFSNVYTSTGRFGGGCVRQATQTVDGYIYTPSSFTEIYVGVAVKSIEATPVTSGSYGFLKILQPSGFTIVFSANNSYGIDCYRATTTLLGSTSGSVLSHDTWHYIEAYVKIDDTTGAVTLKVDGNTELTLTSVDTKRYAEDGNGIVLGANNNSKDFEFDDLYLNSTEFMGDMKVVTKLPNANGTYTDFTPLSGSNYENVDEATPDGDTTYNEANEVGDKDSFSIPTTGIDGRIIGVQLSNYVKKTGTKTTGVKNLVRVGGSDYLGDEEFLSTDYTYKTKTWENNPDSSNPWRKTSIEAAEFGIEVTSLSTTTTTTT